jgi:hypothetical protein
MKIDYRNSSYGLPINDVLVSYQNSDNIVVSIKEKLDEFYKLIEKSDLLNASKILKELSEELGENNPEVVSAKVTLELESIPLED